MWRCQWSPQTHLCVYGCPYSNLSYIPNTAGHFNSSLKICSSFLQWIALNHHITQTLKLKNTTILHYSFTTLAAHQLPHLADSCPPPHHRHCLIFCLSKFLPLTCLFHDELFLSFKSHTDGISEVYVVLRDISAPLFISFYVYLIKIILPHSSRFIATLIFVFKSLAIVKPSCINYIHFSFYTWWLS